MYTGLEASVPVSAMVTWPPDALQLALFALTSKPAGAVTVKLPVIKFTPDTLKVVEDDAVPVVVLKADGAPVVEMMGVATVLEGIATFTKAAPPPVMATLPE